MSMYQVLIIEEELSTRKLIRTTLQEHFDHFIDVKEVASIEKGWQLINNNKLDVVFLDIRLLSKKVLEWLSKWRNLTFDVIFISRTLEIKLVFSINQIGQTTF